MKVIKQYTTSEISPPKSSVLASLQLKLTIDPADSLLTKPDNLNLSGPKSSKIKDLLLPEMLFSQKASPMPEPVLLFNKSPEAPPDKGEFFGLHSVSNGVWYDNKLRTNDGAVIHVLTVQPDKADISVEFSEKGKPVLPSSFKDKNNFLAAINGQFFASSGTIGDMKSGNKIYLDENINKNYDKASDKRYFISVTKDGKLVTGKGGIVENGSISDYKMFLGGMCLLYSRQQLPNLEKDIKSGEFAKRISFSGASQHETISRSFLGITGEGKLLLVAAGEGGLRDKGVDFIQAVHLLKKLGAVEAYCLDGGGSTTMHVKGEKPANTDGRPVKSYISIYSES